MTLEQQVHLLEKRIRALEQESSYRKPIGLIKPFHQGPSDSEIKEVVRKAAEHLKTTESNNQK